MAASLVAAGDALTADHHEGAQPLGPAWLGPLLSRRPLTLGLLCLLVLAPLLSFRQAQVLAGGARLLRLEKQHTDIPLSLPPIVQAAEAQGCCQRDGNLSTLGMGGGNVLPRCRAGHAGASPHAAPLASPTAAAGQDLAASVGRGGCCTGGDAGAFRVSVHQWKPLLRWQGIVVAAAQGACLAWHAIAFGWQEAEWSAHCVQVPRRVPFSHEQLGAAGVPPTHDTCRRCCASAGACQRAGSWQAAGSH